MGSCDDGQSGGSRRYRKWASVAAVLSGLVGIAVTAAVVTGAQLANSPMATASTTKATPWVPHPEFLGKPVRQPGTLVSAQGPSSAATNQKGANWAAKATPPFQAIQASMTDLSNALNEGNVDAMKKACVAMNASSDKLEKTLPTPKDDLTAAVQASVDEIRAMYSACTADPPDGNGVVQHGTAANEHMAEVAKLSQ